jgi:cellobiose epimerase
LLVAEDSTPAMDQATLRDYERRIEADLRQNILPFWMDRVVDRARGSFHGELTADLRVVPNVERGSLLTTRILWTYAAATHRYGDPDYRQMADLAYHDLLTRYLDRAHGGLFWSIEPDDQPRRTRKQVYGQAFGIYALSEYHRVSGSGEALDLAKQLFEFIENRARDREQGGYWEAFARDWSPIEDVRLSEVDQNDPKSQNTLLHVMEAYTGLLHSWPDPRLRAALADLLEVMLTRVVDPHTHHLGLFFSADWEPRSDRISYGHDIEASWLLTEAADAVGDPGLSERVQTAALAIAEVTLTEGVDAEGGIYNQGSPAGVTDSRREWWPQAEAVVGFLNAAQRRGGDRRFIAAALRAWDVIDRHLIDREHGEWFRSVSATGIVDRTEAKVSFWKCPYHNGRTGIEAVARLRALAALPPFQSAAD